tara:strand:+ start:3771 stop:4577 length:807 start_codon:yes stop_codon:yes gene_type:complete
MAYVGNNPAEIYSSVQKQDLTGGSGTSFTLSYPASTNDVSVFVNNVRQEPGVAYTVSGTSMTMTGTVASTDDFYVVFSGLTQGTITPPDASVTTAKIANNAVTSAKLASGVAQAPISVAIIADKKAYNTNGGSSSAATINDRDLNTKLHDPDNIVTISSNQFILGAGTYSIIYSCPAYKVNRNQAQLYDVTNSTVVSHGASVYAVDTYNGHSVSTGYAVVTPTSNTTYKVRHFTEDAFATYGFGVATNSQVSGLDGSFYTQVQITKLA